MTKMVLTPDQQAILDGEKGETLAKVMKTLVMYGEIFGAERMVPVTSRNGHLVTSFGLGVMKPVYALMDQLIEAGALSGQPFSGRPLKQKSPTISPLSRRRMHHAVCHRYCSGSDIQPQSISVYA